MTDTEIEQIARGMSEAQRSFIVSCGGKHEIAMSQPVYDLWFTITKHEQTYFTVGLNSNGLAVRKWIMENSDDN